MQKRCVHKRFVLLAILMALALVALIGGSFVLSSAYAANHGSLQEAATQKTSAEQAGCGKKVPGCEGNASSPDTKPGTHTGDTPSLEGRITSISGTTIIVQSKNLVSTIHLTSNTTFIKFNPLNKESQPASRSVLKIGQVIQAEGTLNSDGSLAASMVSIEG